jgi:hypothetical protein
MGDSSSNEAFIAAGELVTSHFAELAEELHSAKNALFSLSEHHRTQLQEKAMLLRTVASLYTHWAQTQRELNELGDRTRISELEMHEQEEIGNAELADCVAAMRAWLLRSGNELRQNLERSAVYRIDSSESDQQRLRSEYDAGWRLLGLDDAGAEDITPSSSQIAAEEALLRDVQTKLVDEERVADDIQRRIVQAQAEYGEAQEEARRLAQDIDRLSRDIDEALLACGAVDQLIAHITQTIDTIVPEENQERSAIEAQALSARAAIENQEMVACREELSRLAVLVSDWEARLAELRSMHELDNAAYQVAIRMQQGEAEEIQFRIDALHKRRNQTMDNPMDPRGDHPHPPRRTSAVLQLFSTVKNSIRHQALSWYAPDPSSHSGREESQGIASQTVSMAAKNEVARRLQTLRDEVDELSHQVAWYQHQRELIKALLNTSAPPDGAAARNVIGRVAQLLQKIPPPMSRMASDDDSRPTTPPPSV